MREDEFILKQKSKIFLVMMVLSILTIFIGCTKEVASDESEKKAVNKELAQKYAQGTELYNKGEFEKAREIFIDCIEKDKKEGKYEIALGNTYLKEKNYDKALTYYQNAIAKSPNYIESYNNSAGILMLKKEYDKVLDILEKGLEIEENNNELLFKKGQTLFVKEDYEVAIKVFDQLKEDAKYFEVYRFIGLSYLKLDNKKEALKNLKEYVKIAPENAKPKKSISDIISLIQGENSGNR